jgi:hypothetical protein
MGGMIGGAILGALVNKIQGKDWKRGALMGWPITGGITGGMTGQGGIAKWLGSTPGATWLKTNPGPFKGMIAKAAPYLKMPFVQAGIGAGAAQMMGDPEYDRRKQQEYMDYIESERKRKNMEMYGDWYNNPWEGWNKGGIINARPGYYNGGSATLDYTDPDLYTPTGEGGGPSSNPIMQLPLGPEGSFTDEFDELDMTELNDQERGELQSLMTIRLMTPKDDPKYEQIEIRIQELLGRMDTAMSEPHPDEGSYDMFFDEFGRYPKDPEELQNIYG